MFVLFAVKITIAAAGCTVSIFYILLSAIFYTVVLKHSSGYVEMFGIRLRKNAFSSVLPLPRKDEPIFKNYRYNTSNEILCNDNFIIIIILCLNIILYTKLLKIVRRYCVNRAIYCVRGCSTIAFNFES